MQDRHGAGRAAFWLLGAMLAALCAGEARAADCFSSLAANAKWSCTAQLSTGEPVTYCLNLLVGKGSGPSASRFDMVASGPYPRTCSCGAKGKLPSPLFDVGSSYLCVDEGTGTAEIGKIARRKIVGETYNASVNVRSTFKCKVDDACVVLP
jgi:hypothetical protein